MSFLQKDEAVLLREAYVAYLVANDFKRLGNMNEAEIITKIPTLKSVTEMANLEKNTHESMNLFTEKGFSRFFPKYDSIEWYFTGMFVFNMLWEKKPLKDYNNYYYDEVSDLFRV